MILNSEPYNWNSAHRPVTFVYDHETKPIDTLTDSGGFLKVQLDSSYTFTPDPGERIYISGTDNGIYNGYHVIASATGGGEIVTTTAYTGADDGGDCLYIRLPEIELYKGYDTGETFDTELPLTLIATFTPRNSINNDVTFDVSGWLKAIFTSPVSPPQDATYDFLNFNRFRLKFDGDYQDFYHVLNSAIESEELDGYYADTGRPLQVGSFIFDCGDNVVSYLQRDGLKHFIDTATALNADDSEEGGGGGG